MKKILIYFILFKFAAGDLFEKLRHFETLHHVDVKVVKRRKRSVDGPGIETKDVSFSAFGRNFNLVLTPGSPVLSGDFKAHLVHGDGRMSPLLVNNNHFFTGHLAGDESVKADAHTEDGLWTANVYDRDDTYILEPSERHLPPSDNHTMIIYRQSDMKWDNLFPDLDKKPNKRKKICGAVHAEDDPDYDPRWEEEMEAEYLKHKHASNRSKRASSSQNTCHIIAVADYKFFEGPGGNFQHRAANYVIQTMQKVNRIFKNTLWSPGSSLRDMGFQIKELRIHDGPTSVEREYKGLHYNMDRDKWPDHDLLKQFGEDSNLHNFCLAHLFTHRIFADGVLGLAYIAPPYTNALGGICSYTSRSRRAMNTGFSSTLNTRGNNLLTQEAVLVTAHEFGHNWGAEHDAETSECAPNAFNNGKFLMYPYAVSGFDENNNNFSPCSKRFITKVLAARSGICFEEEEEARTTQLKSGVPLCGNGIVDTGEDCDGGGFTLSGQDSCCDKDCKFIGDATCSPFNYECCVDCQMASAGTRCRGENKDLCQREATCTGFKYDCPKSKAFDNEEECMDKGKCLNGTCVDFCRGIDSLKELYPCQCDQDRVSACQRCCKEKNGPCEVQDNGGPLPNGRPCAFGYCNDDGYCKTGKANMIKRLFSFIENLDSSTLVAFMKANIVGTIILFSLIVWIPASWTVSCIDKKKEKKSREGDLQWMSREGFLNTSLQSHQFGHLDDYKIRESGRFNAGDMRSRYAGHHQPPQSAQRYKTDDDEWPQNGRGEKTYNFGVEGGPPIYRESVL